MAKIFATATVYPEGLEKQSMTYMKCAHMTPDLPADELGELVADVSNEAFQAGHDPCTKGFMIILTFDLHSD